MLRESMKDEKKKRKDMVFIDFSKAYNMIRTKDIVEAIKIEIKEGVL